VCRWHWMFSHFFFRTCFDFVRLGNVLVCCEAAACVTRRTAALTNVDSTKRCVQLCTSFLNNNNNHNNNNNNNNQEILNQQQQQQQQLQQFEVKAEGVRMINARRTAPLLADVLGVRHNVCVSAALALAVAHARSTRKGSLAAFKRRVLYSPVRLCSSLCFLCFFLVLIALLCREFCRCEWTKCARIRRRSHSVCLTCLCHVIHPFLPTALWLTTVCCIQYAPPRCCVLLSLIVGCVYRCQAASHCAHRQHFILLWKISLLLTLPNSSNFNFFFFFFLLFFVQKNLNFMSQKRYPRMAVWQDLMEAAERAAKDLPPKVRK